jgi:hypothetical protein
MQLSSLLSVILVLGAAEYAEAADKCEDLVKGTMIKITARVEKVVVDVTTEPNGIRYVVDKVNGLPCELDLTGPLPTTLYVNVPGALRPRCRVGQVITASGAAEYVGCCFGASSVETRGIEVSCQ